MRTLLLSVMACLTVVGAEKDPADWVDVFTGTSNSRWMLFPGATTPFGLVKLSPDNQGNVWNGGYEYTIGSISGFSHLHAMSLAGVSVMPAVGKVEPYPGQARVFAGTGDGPFGGMWTAGYRSRYRKESEKGSPGYYSVELLDAGVTVELTATKRCGVMRFTYPAAEEARLVFDFDFAKEEKEEVVEVRVRRVSDREIEGSVRQRNQYAGEYTVYFVAQLDRGFERMRGWEREEYGGKETNYGTQWRAKTALYEVRDEFRGGARSGVMLEFATKAGERVGLRTGISLVDVEGARRNLEREAAPFGWDFDKAAAGARAEWNEVMGSVRVKGGTEDDRRKFYTNFYRAYSAKSVVSDADGRFRDACGEIGKLNGAADAVYSSDGFWGTQWNLTPLWTLVSPKVARSWVNFYLTMFERHGWTPEAPVRGGYAPIMGAQHHLALMASSILKGIGGIDREKAWAAMKHDLSTPGEPFRCGGYAGNRHAASYAEKGYVTEEAGPVSNTLEYAYDDWCAACVADALGKREEAERFARRSQNFRAVWDAETKYFRRRHADGRWVGDFDPHRFGTTGGWNGPGYVEGTAWVYTWFVPHDVEGLIGLLGKEEFNRRLEEGFAKGYVDLTNQPNLHVPFLFNYSGKPWLTQRETRRLAGELFDTSPYRGWLGEEDEGQMGALAVLLSMGLFEVSGGCAKEPYYDLSSPAFEEVEIALDKETYGGRRVRIVARNQSRKNVYVQRARWNGVELKRPRIGHAELVKGGVLEYEMGPEPGRNWAER
jgi:predicted alpha-1,2-mannosidase